MLILAAILIALLTPCIVLGLSFSRLRSGYLWFLALISALSAWGLVIAARGQIPIVIPLADWQSALLFSASPTLLIDEISWPFALAVMTLPLAALLADITRVNELDPHTWASVQALGGLGLVAVLAGNPLTMLMAWAVIDIVEGIVLLLRMSGSDDRERVVISFAVRIAGMLLLVAAMLRAAAVGQPFTFENIPVPVGGYLMLAAGLRLGVLPPNQPHLQEPLMRRGLGTLTRLMPAAASTVLLVRASQVELAAGWVTVFMLLAAVSALLSAFAWGRAQTALQGRPYWILGLSTFVLASAAQGRPVASATWGLAMLFSGALLFLFSAHHRGLLILLGLGAVGFSGLPLTPSWDGSALFIGLPWGYRLVFFAALALLFLGYLRYMRQAAPAGATPERWVWLVYPLGLALLPLTHFGLVYTKWLRGVWVISFQTPGWWNGLIPLLFAAVFLFVGRRTPMTFPAVTQRMSGAFNWVYRFIWWGYRAFGRILYAITRLLEGEGSVLWALLILVMLVVTINLWGRGDGFEF